MIPIAAPAKTFQLRLAQPIVRSRVFSRSEAMPDGDVLAHHRDRLRFALELGHEAEDDRSRRPAARRCRSSTAVAPPKR